MKQPSIKTVKEKFQAYRRTRKSRRQAFPTDIRADIHRLLKSNRKSKLKKELEINDATIN